MARQHFSPDFFSKAKCVKAQIASWDLALGIVFLMMFSNSASAQWADLEFTVVFDGEIPRPVLVDVNKSEIQCEGNLNVIELESLVINPKNKGLANVVFSLDTRLTKLKDSQIHPDLLELPEEKVALEIVNCRFVPHVLAVRVGQTIEVLNSSRNRHHIKFSFFNDAGFNPVIPSDGRMEITPTEVERAPTRVDCNIHPWMSAFVVVNEHPYTAVSDNDGKVIIRNLPANTPLAFKIWHENQTSAIEDLRINGESQKWKRGTEQLTLREGKNDLGIIELSSDQFRLKGR